MMGGFDDLKFEAHSGHRAGVQAKMFWPNGYGVSVIQAPYSYGGDEGLYEMAVLVGSEGKYSLTYKTPVTDDVLGYLTPEMVSMHMAEVAALSKAGGQS